MINVTVYLRAASLNRSLPSPAAVVFTARTVLVTAFTVGDRAATSAATATTTAIVRLGCTASVTLKRRNLRSETRAASAAVVASAFANIELVGEATVRCFCIDCGAWSCFVTFSGAGSNSRTAAPPVLATVASLINNFRGFPGARCSFVELVEAFENAVTVAAAVVCTNVVFAAVDVAVAPTG